METSKSTTEVQMSTEPFEKTARTSISEPHNPQETATLAYQLWLERGCPIGSPEVDWFQAEEQLKNGQARTLPAA